MSDYKGPVWEVHLYTPHSHGRTAIFSTREKAEKWANAWLAGKYEPSTVKRDNTSTIYRYDDIVPYGGLAGSVQLKTIDLAFWPTKEEVTDE